MERGDWEIFDLAIPGFHLFQSVPLFEITKSQNPEVRNQKSLP